MRSCSFLVESMEEEFAGVVGINVALWLLVLLWIMVPPGVRCALPASSLGTRTLCLLGLLGLQQTNGLLGSRLPAVQPCH